MQTQNEPHYPRPRAVFSKYTLVQFDRETFFVLDEKEIKGVDVKVGSNLPNFSPSDFKEKIHGKTVDQIENRQVQTYGPKKFEIFIFSLGKEEERMWLSKTAFANAVGDTSGELFKKGLSTLNYKEWKAKGGGSHQDNDDIVMADESSSDQRVEAQDAKREPSLQRKTRDDGQITSRANDGSKDRRKLWTREGLVGESGETPEPRDGGEVIYGIRCDFGKPKIRGLVFRDGAYEFEVLRHCDSKRMIPKQKAGMAPKADNLFIGAMNKSDRTGFSIEGCAAKRHGKSGKQVIVILNITDKTLQKNLRAMRGIYGYEYDGPLVCNLSSYRAAFGEQDIRTLEEHLSMTQFAVDANEEEVSLEKGNKKRPKLDESLETMGREIRKVSEKLSRICVTIEEASTTE